MGLQFHPEVTTHGMERWLIGNAAEINQLEHTSISKLREKKIICMVVIWSKQPNAFLLIG